MTPSDKSNTLTENNMFPPPEVLKRLAISESGFVFDPASGHNFTVNETGLMLLRLMQKEQRLDDILKILTTEYDAEPRDIERDILDFVSTLRDNVGA